MILRLSRQGSSEEVKDQFGLHCASLYEPLLLLPIIRHQALEAEQVVVDAGKRVGSWRRGQWAGGGGRQIYPL